MEHASPPKYDRTRVVKRLSPIQPGALKLARRYGDALVCVRYRQDESGSHRYTTVELVVDDAPVAVRRHRDTDVVAIRFEMDDMELRKRALQNGAVWDHKVRLWYMMRATATKLELLDKIVSKISRR